MDWTGATKQGAINMPHSFDATNIHFHGDLLKGGGGGACPRACSQSKLW
jgi:hypothetical protein